MASSAAAPTAAGEPGWLTERRKRGAEQATSLELPTPKVKGWEFTILDGLDLAAYPAAEGGDAEAQAVGTADRLALQQPEGSFGLAQVDALSLPSSDLPEPSGNGRPSEPVVMPLDLAAERYPDLIEEHLGTLVDDEDPFVARNDSEWSGGALVYVPAGKQLDAPVALTAIQAAAGKSMSWRVLIVLEDNAEAEVWERYLSADDQIDSLFNAAVEIHIGAGANLRYISSQDLNQSGWVFGTQRASIGSQAHLEWIALGFGSGQGKLRMETKLNGRGASARVTGAYVGDGDQRLEYDTRQEHAAEDTTSDLAFRGVLNGNANAVWRGMIRVDPEAQRTDAFQDCRNLLISTTSHADAVPGLEIEADDVACTHAAAVVQADAEQLFYLRSRGIEEGLATRLVIEGFLQELVERVPEGPLNEALSGAVATRLGELLD